MLYLIQYGVKQTTEKQHTADFYLKFILADYKSDKSHVKTLLRYPDEHGELRYCDRYLWENFKLSTLLEPSILYLNNTYQAGIRGIVKKEEGEQDSDDLDRATSCYIGERNKHNVVYHKLERMDRYNILLKPTKLFLKDYEKMYKENIKDYFDRHFIEYFDIKFLDTTVPNKFKSSIT